jgi:hypothetical protein
MYKYSKFCFICIFKMNGVYQPFFCRFEISISSQELPPDLIKNTHELDLVSKLKSSLQLCPCWREYFISWKTCKRVKLDFSLPLLTLQTSGMHFNFFVVKNFLRIRRRKEKRKPHLNIWTARQTRLPTTSGRNTTFSRYSRFFKLSRDVFRTNVREFVATCVP